SLRKICDDHVATGRKLVLCGDYNVSHKPIDLARLKENEKTAELVRSAEIHSDVIGSDHCPASVMVEI
ncbi:MAG: hypothetical protein V3S41_02670, partial [Spirochaetia bacterium]